MPNLEAQLAYSIPQVAELIGETDLAVRRRIERGELPARRWGRRRIVILREDLEQHLRSLPVRNAEEPGVA
jgi:excisionase family DNA binding protein